MAPDIRVLIVDDNESLRRMLSTMLSFEDGIDVVGTAEDAEDALERIVETRPDVIILDNQMPGRSGVEALPEMLLLCSCTVIMHTAHASPADQATALRLGAAIIAKGGSLQDLVAAIRATAD